MGPECFRVHLSLSEPSASEGSNSILQGSKKSSLCCVPCTREKIILPISQKKLRLRGVKEFSQGQLVVEPVSTPRRFWEMTSVMADSRLSPAANRWPGISALVLRHAVPDCSFSLLNRIPLYEYAITCLYVDEHCVATSLEVSQIVLLWAVYYVSFGECLLSTFVWCILGSVTVGL